MEGHFAHMREKKGNEVWWESQKERDHLEGLDIGSRIIL
jgi:hypothetical protein